MTRLTRATLALLFVLACSPKPAPQTIIQADPPHHLMAAAGPSYAQPVNPSLDSTIKTAQVFCGQIPVAIPVTPLTGRGQLTLINTSTVEAFIGECTGAGPGVGVPLAAGTIAAPGGSFVLPIGPDVTAFCCASASTQPGVDAGPAVCPYETVFDGGPFDAGPSFFCPYDSGVCADAGTSCNACSGTCLADGGPNCPSVGLLDGGLVYDGGCLGGGLVVEEIAR
jgi:hypothetical protein